MREEKDLGEVLEIAEYLGDWQLSEQAMEYLKRRAFEERGLVDVEELRARARELLDEHREASELERRDVSERIARAMLDPAMGDVIRDELQRELDAMHAALARCGVAMGE